MPKGTKETTEPREITGVCRYCCQTRLIQADGNMTEEEITEKATLSCDCDAAKTYRQKTECARAAKDNIDMLFGEDSDFPQTGKMTDLMKGGVDMINSGRAKSMTIKMNKGMQCRIAMTTDGKIKVLREVKSVVEFKQ